VVLVVDFDGTIAVGRVDGPTYDSLKRLKETPRDGSRRSAAAASRAKTVTFKEAAEKYIASHKAAWRNDIHRRQRTNPSKT
jgi:hypothetical protein